uniref:Uncharacterized protein n=1 Tax=Leersia perrieri TaxID=77586 RepID=A0A0D9XH86_9ORYZ
MTVEHGELQHGDDADPSAACAVDLGGAGYAAGALGLGTSVARPLGGGGSIGDELERGEVAPTSSSAPPSHARRQPPPAAPRPPSRTSPRRHRPPTRAMAGFAAVPPPLSGWRRTYISLPASPHATVRSSIAFPGGAPTSIRRRRRRRAPRRDPVDAIAFDPHLYTEAQNH